MRLKFFNTSKKKGRKRKREERERLVDFGIIRAIKAPMIFDL